MRSVPALALVLLTALPATALSVEIRARAIAPGEPVRIVVETERELAELDASFLGRDVAFHPDGAGHWAGWSLVALDAEAGLSVLELQGRLADGSLIEATHAFRVEARSFPEERLSVAPRYVEPPAEVRERLADERRRLAAIYARRDPGPELTFTRPVPGEPTSPFGTRRVFNGKPRAPHSGIDLEAATGTPVLASAAGTVALAEDLYYSGGTVLVDHGGGLFTIYAHLSEIEVEVGARVEAGSRIGLSGATGRVTGPHLHWGAKIGDVPFDPLALLEPVF